MTKKKAFDVLRTERTNLQKLPYKTECTSDAASFSNSNTAITLKETETWFNVFYSPAEWKDLGETRQQLIREQ